VIGRSNSERVYCANTTELVALKLVNHRWGVSSTLLENKRTREVQISWQMQPAQRTLDEGKLAQETLPPRQTVRGRSLPIRCRQTARLKKANQQTVRGNRLARTAPSANIGVMAQKDSDNPMEPTEFRMTPGTENIPDPSSCPRFSITADSSVTS
jgi:hypothetical protein